MVFIPASETWVPLQGSLTQSLPKTGGGLERGTYGTTFMILVGFKEKSSFCCTKVSRRQPPACASERFLEDSDDVS